MRGQPLRILHILNELRPSGAEIMLKAAASYWQSQGIKGEILSAGEQIGPYAAQLEASGFRLWHIPFSRSVSFVANILRFLRESESYDVIHIHPERASFWYALLARLAGLRRVVRTIHSVFPFRGFLRRRRSLQRWLCRDLLGVRMVSVSPAVQESELKCFGNPTHVIPNWFDDRRFRPPSTGMQKEARESLALPSKAFVTIAVGGVNPWKNFAALINAMALLKEHREIVLLRVGQESESERRLVEQQGLSGCIRFLGLLHDPLPAFHAADVFVMPSIREGFAIAALEAMGAGLPVILSDIPSLRELGEACDGIHWIEPTPEHIAHALLSFRRMRPRARAERGERLSKCVHKHYPISNGAGQYAELYRGLVNEEHRRHEQ